jgi:hypothetical protein
MHAAESARSLMILVLLLGLCLASPPGAQAEPTSPGRSQTIIVRLTQHHWWLTQQSDGQILCTILVEHEALPTRAEIRDDCGEETYQTWLEAADCGDCEPLYLHHIGSERISRQVIVKLPPASVDLYLSDCDTVSGGNRCDQLPTLTFIGHEPLPNEAIAQVRGTVDGITFSCPQERCTIQLRPTGTQGSRISFWAVSTFGDSSEHYEARVRVSPAGSSGWHVDVLSSQWRGTPAPSCAAAWGSLPPPGGLPEWLTTPGHPSDLASNHVLVRLSDSLVRWGAVDTSGCPGGGFMSDGSLNACGLEVVRPVASEWQNRFDQRILAVGLQENVPAFLLKRLFATESQFWPGVYDGREDEIGFGHLTLQGADATMLWNSEFFSQFCPLVLSEHACDQGYSALLAGEQEVLRGALLRTVDASCPSCPSGIDLSRADASISVFAETLLANCNQVARLVENTTEFSPGDIASFEDLWLMTLANYHAGPGCLGTALEAYWDEQPALTWLGISGELEVECPWAIDYVQAITDP